MAFALAGHGYFEESLAQFTAAQKVVPDSVELQVSIVYGMAWVLLVSGDSKRALRKISTALKLMKDLDQKHLLYMEARQLYVETLSERCDYRKALKVLGDVETQLLQDRDRNMIELGAVLRKRAAILQVMGKTKEAAEAYTKAIEWKERAQECSYGLASCYCQLGDVNMELHALSGIREYFERAVSTLVDAKCDPEHVTYLVATGKLYFSKMIIRDVLKHSKRRGKLFGSFHSISWISQPMTCGALPAHIELVDTLPRLLMCIGKA